jgi:hypothetical protein
MDAIYILTPKPHIVDCIMAEFEQRRYQGFFLIWTTRKRLKNHAMPSVLRTWQYFHHR